VVSLPTYANVVHLGFGVGEFFLIILKVKRFIWLVWEGILINDIMGDDLFFVVFFSV
jgi:hypothetical protein